MKKNFSRKALCVLLTLAVALAFMPMTAFAATPEGELIKKGQTKEFVNGAEGKIYYHFHLDKPSKVVMTAEFITAGGDPPYDTFDTAIHEKHWGNTTVWGYTEESRLKESTTVGTMEILSSGDTSKWVNLFTWKGEMTYYLNANKPNEFYYIFIRPLYEEGSKAKVSVTWSDIRSDGGNTKNEAKKIDALKGATVKYVTQDCSAGNWFKLTVPGKADLTVKHNIKSIVPKPVSSSGFLEISNSKGTSIGNKYQLMEKGIAGVSKTTEYRLPKAGTYYVNVDSYWSSTGSEHALNIKAKLVKPSKIKLNKTKHTLKKGKTYTLKVKKWSPAGVKPNKVTWKSSNPKVVKVNKTTGKIKAVKKGKATITAKTANGKTAKCKVNVK